MTVMYRCYTGYGRFSAEDISVYGDMLALLGGLSGKMVWLSSLVEAVRTSKL